MFLVCLKITWEKGRWSFVLKLEAESLIPPKGQDSEAFPTGQHGVHLKWFFLSHSSKRKREWQRTRKGCLHAADALVIVTQLTKHLLAPNCQINQHFHLFKFKTQGWCIDYSQRVVQNQKSPLPKYCFKCTWSSSEHFGLFNYLRTHLFRIVAKNIDFGDILTWVQIPLLLPTTCATLSK